MIGDSISHSTTPAALRTVPLKVTMPVAGRLFDAQARAAWAAAAAAQGVGDPEAKKMIGEAKRRLRGP